MGAISITLNAKRLRGVGFTTAYWSSAGLVTKGVHKQPYEGYEKFHGMMFRAKTKASKDIQSVLWENTAHANDIIKDYIGLVYSILMQESPVLTGAYLASHEINARNIHIGENHNGFSTEKAVYKDPSLKETNREAAMKVAQGNLNKWVNTRYTAYRNGNVELINNRPYADKVETQYTTLDSSGGPRTKYGEDGKIAWSHDGLYIYALATAQAIAAGS